MIRTPRIAPGTATLAAVRAAAGAGSLAAARAAAGAAPQAVTPTASDSLRVLRNQSAIDSLRAQIPSGMGDIDTLGMLVQTVIYLALVAAVLYVALRWGVPRIFGRRIPGKGSLELVERLPLGGNRSVCIVKADGKKYLIGVTDHEICALDVLDDG